MFLIRCLLTIFIFPVFLCQEYSVVYIFEYSLEQKLPKNEVRIYEKFRFDAEVHMNRETRQLYYKSDKLKNISDLNSQILLRPQFKGTMRIQKSKVPKYMWIDKKQVILIEVDLSVFPNSTDDLKKYQGLFKHKGNSFYIYNSDQVNQTLKKQLEDLFGLQSSQICHVDMMNNKLQENTAKIEECLKGSRKKPLIQRNTANILSTLYQYGLVGFTYIVLCFLVACVSPYLMIWWHQRQFKNLSHV